MTLGNIKHPTLSLQAQAETEAVMIRKQVEQKQRERVAPPKGGVSPPRKQWGVVNTPPIISKDTQATGKVDEGKPTIINYINYY